jgi:peptidoglycan/xylan/chitin deacetylase (PgdA/CDA1 family)
MLFRFIAVCLLSLVAVLPAAAATPSVNVPILLYHRFGPTVADGMTMKTSVFEEHLKFLKENGYKVIPLRQLVNWYQKKGPAPAPKSVVIVEDDAHKSVYTDMLPLAKKYNVPVTVFIYPSAISNAKYAMTWDQLRELKKTGLFDFQSHTYWHPNFKKERRKLSPAEFDKLTSSQLTKAKSKIEKELGGTVDLLAWPFGIYDDDLLRRAAAAGYIGTFTIERRHATAGDSLMKLPRYLLINADQGKAFSQVLAGTAPKRDVVY